MDQDNTKQPEDSNSPLSRYEQLQKDLYLAGQSRAVWWAEKKFRWTPKAFYQVLLLGCLDKVYRYPDDYPIAELRGEIIQKFAWRIGRQSGKTECLAIAALYLGICKPITEYKKCKPTTPGAVKVYPGRDKRVKKSRKTGQYPPGAEKVEPKEGNLKPYYVIPYWGIPFKRGAKIIMASADADKAKTVFDRVMKFLNDCTEFQLAMEQEIIRVKKHPFPTVEIDVEGWKFPAEIMFRGPGAKGQALRSKTFDYKLYDEADYFPPSFFEAEKATGINAGDDAVTILSSTPSGRRDHFFKACFAPGTKVQMADGSEKNIEDIKIGDEVINRFGATEPVTDTMNRPYNGPMIRFNIYPNIEDDIYATPNHRFMAVRKRDRFCEGCRSIVWENGSECPLHDKHKGFKPVKPAYFEIGKLREGDYLAIPRKIWKGETSGPDITHITDNFVYVPITHHYKVQFWEGTVYNLTVGEDHSYNVSGLGVANCTDASWGYKEFWFPSWENPNYTTKKDREFRAELNQTAYEHEIMADWGTVEMGVFDWTYFQKVFAYEYDNVAKHNKYEYRLIKFDSNDIKHIGMPNLGNWLKDRFVPINPLAKYWFGADLGYSADPSEFVVFEEFNGVMKMVMRIHMEHLTYDIQADMIALLDTYFKFQMLGMDAGNNGTSVAQILQAKRQGWNRFAHHRFDKRLLPIPFGGRLMIDKRNGKEITEPAKQAMTNMIIHAAEMKLLIMPGLNYDESCENQFRNHTYSVGAGGQIVYSKGSIYPDHIIDAVRTAFYARTASQFVNKRNLPSGGLGRARPW